MSFENKIKVLKRLKEAGIKDSKNISSLTTKQMLEMAKGDYKFLEGIVDLQDNTKDIFAWLMQD